MCRQSPFRFHGVSGCQGLPRDISSIFWNGCFQTAVTDSQNTEMTHNLAGIIYSILLKMSAEGQSYLSQVNLRQFISSNNPGGRYSLQLDRASAARELSMPSLDSRGGRTCDQNSCKRYSSV